MSWSDERIDRLKKLWMDGLSASQIASDLGGVTRNAVIGKVHRLGLSGRAKSNAATMVRSRKAARVARGGTVAAAIPVARGNLALATVVEAVAESRLKPQAEVVIAISRRISIMEIREGLCRWPLGDPLQAEFAFCGADCSSGKVYCTQHARVAFQPPSERRREH